MKELIERFRNTGSKPYPDVDERRKNINQECWDYSQYLISIRYKEVTIRIREERIEHE